jgi:hypothetical protein
MFKVPSKRDTHRVRRSERPSTAPSVTELIDLYWDFRDLPVSVPHTAEYVIPYCICDPPNPKALLLLEALIESKYGDLLITTLVSEHFHETLFARLPSRECCFVLRSLLRHSSDVLQWAISTDSTFLQTIDTYFQSPDACTPDIVWLFSILTFADPGAAPLYEHLAALALRTDDISLFEEVLDACGYQASKDTRALELFFVGDWFARLLADCVNPEKAHSFLRFIYKCLSNRDCGATNVDGGAAHAIVGDARRRAILELIIASLASSDVPLVLAACASLSRVIWGSETVAFCFERDCWSILLGLLDGLDEFSAKRMVFRAICAIAASSNAQQADGMVVNGFFEILDVYIDQMIFTIPVEVIDALQTFERHAELEGRRDWFELVFTDKIAGLLQEVVDSGLDIEMDKDMTVADAARALLQRIEDWPTVNFANGS